VHFFFGATSEFFFGIAVIKRQENKKCDGGAGTEKKIPYKEFDLRPGWEANRGKSPQQ